MEIEAAKNRIRSALGQNGPCTYNRISSILRRVTEGHGVITVNDLIDEFNLADIFGIEKVRIEHNFEAQCNDEKVYCHKCGAVKEES